MSLSLHTNSQTNWVMFLQGYKVCFSWRNWKLQRTHGSTFTFSLLLYYLHMAEKARQSLDDFKSSVSHYRDGPLVRFLRHSFTNPGWSHLVTHSSHGEEWSLCDDFSEIADLHRVRTCTLSVKATKIEKDLVFFSLAYIVPCHVVTDVVYKVCHHKTLSNTAELSLRVVPRCDGWDAITITCILFLSLVVSRNPCEMMMMPLLLSKSTTWNKVKVATP